MERTDFPGQWSKAVEAIASDSVEALSRCVRVTKVFPFSSAEKVARKVASARGMAPAGDMLDNDDSLLMRCAMRGAVHCAKYLLQDFRVLANCSSKHGEGNKTALMAAMERGDTDMVKILLPHVQLRWEADSLGDPPLARAVKAKSLPLVETLMAVCKESGGDYGGLGVADAALAAIAIRSGAMLERLGMDSLWRSHIFCGEAAMALAAAPTEEVTDLRASLLVRRVVQEMEGAHGFIGAQDILARKRDRKSMRMLDVAAAAGNAPVVRMLLGRKVKLLAPEDAGEPSALHYAARGGNAECVELLGSVAQAEGALDAKNRVDGGTALHWAAAAGHVECVKLLLDMGADPAARDGQGMAPGGSALASQDKAPGSSASAAGRLIRDRAAAAERSAIEEEKAARSAAFARGLLERRAKERLAKAASSARGGLGRMAELVAKEAGMVRPAPKPSIKGIFGGFGG